MRNRAISVDDRNNAGTYRWKPDRPKRAPPTRPKLTPSIQRKRAPSRRQKSRRVPAPVIPSTLLAVSQEAERPRARAHIEELSETQKAKLIEDAERDELIKKIDLPSRSCEYF